MEARMYKIKVVGSVLAMVHGFRRVVSEIYIPEYGLYVNKEVVFLEDNEENPRYKQGFEVEDIVMTKAFAKKCLRFATLKTELLEAIPVLFEELEIPPKPPAEEEVEAEGE